MLSFDEIDAVFQQHYFDGMGCVSHGDARFLCDLIQESQPTKCFEVGVASGMSTAFLLKALAKLGPERELVSVDISSQYYADRTKQVGYVVDLAIPELVANLISSSIAGQLTPKLSAKTASSILCSLMLITVTLGRRWTRC